MSSPSTLYDVEQVDDYLVLTPRRTMSTSFPFRQDARLAETVLTTARCIIVDFRGDKTIIHNALADLDDLWQLHGSLHDGQGDIRLISDQASTFNLIVRIMSLSGRLLVFKTMDEATAPPQGGAQCR